MAVDSISNAVSQSTGSTGTSSTSDLGQTDFLQLMIAQLKNQDPTKPADPTQFISELAQFSTVSGIQDMQKSLTTLSDSLRSSQVLNGTSLVGHYVLADASQATLSDTGSIVGTTTIPSGASSASIAITDASGQLVRTIPVSNTEGQVQFTWDGTENDGTRAPAGSYSFSAIANVGSSSEQLTTQLAAYVDSVSIDSSDYTLTLNTDLGNIALSSVRQVM